MEAVDIAREAGVEVIYNPAPARELPAEAFPHITCITPNETEAAYRLLWKRFYDTVAIRERENPKLRMTHMPKRYWSTMTEFQDDPYFTPQSSAAAVPVPGVPAGKPAPVIYAPLRHTPAAYRL